jgi:hypothetical protein
VTRYNTPSDSDLLGIIASMRRRIDRLERFSRQQTIATTSPIKASDYTTAVAVTSATFVDVFVFPYIFLAHTPIARFTATCTDATTSGEYRLVDANHNELQDRNNNAVATMTIPLGTTTETSFENDADPNYWTDYTIGSDQFVLLQVRRTAGAGTINVKAKYLAQIPS